MNDTADNANTMRWVAIGLGGVALIAAVVALVLSLSEDDSASQSDVNSSVASLDKRLDQIEGEATAAGETGKKAEQNLNKAEKRAKKTQGENTTQITNLSDQVTALQKKVDDLSNQEAAQQQEIKQLQKQVNKLK